MAIVKHSPLPPRGRFQDLAELRQRMLQLFEEPFGLPIFRESLGWMPEVDITESDTEIVLEAELPGMDKDDVEIEIDGNVLTLRGEKKQEKEEQEKGRYLYERSYGAFQRSFSLPATVKEEAVKAEFRKGVLRVALPKDGAPRGKKIQIAG